jgi:hypothetical protein
MAIIKVEEIFENIIKFARDNDYDIVISDNNEEGDIDFININIKKKTVYMGELDVTDDLTPVG